MLIQKGLLEFPILYLSAFIINEKEDYYYLLNSVSTRNNWKDWIKFMLKAIEETSCKWQIAISNFSQLRIHTKIYFFCSFPKEVLREPLGDRKNFFGKT